MNPNPLGLIGSFVASAMISCALVMSSAALTVNVPGDYSTLQGAISAAIANTTIDHIQVTGDLHAWHDIVIDGLSQNLLIEGENVRNRTIIDAESEGRHFHIGGLTPNVGTITFRTFELINGTIDNELGGSIYAISTSLVFEDCIMHDNNASGGGTFAFSGPDCSLTVEDCEIYGSNADEGAVLKVINFDADFNVMFRRCFIHDNSSSGAGGVIYALGYETIFFDECVVKDNEALSFNDGGGVLMAALSQGEISANNSVFSGNQSAGRGTCFSIQSGNISLSNCLFFANNASGSGDVQSLIHFTHQTAGHINSIVGCTFADNLSFDEPNTMGCLVYDINDDFNSGQVQNCTFSGNGYAFSGVASGISLTYTNIFDNSENWSTRGLSAFSPELPNNPFQNMSVDPTYVTPGSDYRLRWNSPLMDVGGPLSSIDFDPTNPDIGWGQSYDPVELANDQFNLPVGWYIIPDEEEITVTYTDAVPPGTMFRMGESSTLSLVGSATSGTFSIGDLSSVRTAITGKTIVQEETYFASTLTIGATAGEEVAIQGTMFHGLPNELVFDDCHVELLASTVTSQNRIYNLPANSVFNLHFVDCAGEVNGFDFTDAPFTATHVSLLRSSVDVRNCQFGQPNTTAGYALMVDGHAAGTSFEIKNCEFEGGSTAYPSLKLQDSDPRLDRNAFDDCKFRAIWSYLGVFDMSHGAKNSIKSELLNPPTISQFMYLFTSPVYLKCGDNNFVFNDVNAQTDFDFIYYRGSEPAMGQGAPDVKNYTENYWGSSCSNSVSVNGRIPVWANPGTQLSGCSNPADPTPSLCQDIIWLAAMLQDGLDNENSGDFASAQETYFDIVEQYPDSREARVAALRLKGLGMISVDEGAVADLQALGTAIESEDAFLGAYLACAAECVRAWKGDVTSAQANLVALRDGAATEEEAILAQKNLLEIQTYPTGSSLSALGGRTTRHHVQARRDLQAFDPEDPFRIQPRGVSAMERPASVRIECAWPNPFNPTTTLRIHLWETLPTAVRVYNLKGERVATLHEGVLTAGSHEFMWQAGAVASGMYLLRVETPRHMDQTKVLYLK